MPTDGIAGSIVASSIEETFAGESGLPEDSTKNQKNADKE
jgi:hypothetical protein